MITIQYTVPVDNTTGLFLNDPIKVSFSQSIEPSYLTTDYFMLYRTNQDYTEYYEQVNVNPTIVNDYVNIQPTINLLQNTNYIMMVIGGENGIQSTTADTLNENLLIKFVTGDSLRVSSTVDIDVIGGNNFMDGTSGAAPGSISNDLFALSGENASIYVVSAIPADQSLGVDGLDKIIIKFNDTIANQTLPVNTLTGRYNDIPYDFDPFTDHDITPTSVEISNNLAIFTIPVLSGELNREYTFQVSPGIVRGATRQGTMYEPFEFKFYSKLNPIYATPDQIVSRLKGFSDSAQITISRAEIYKLILEESLYVREKYKITVTPETMPIINKLVVCMVLRDILINGYIMLPSIKSRTLISTSVVYYDFNSAEAKNALDDCIKDAILDAGGLLGVTISSGIKSGNNMNRPTKDYGIYR